MGNPLWYTYKDDFHSSSYKTKFRIKRQINEWQLEIKENR